MNKKKEMEVHNKPRHPLTIGDAINRFFDDSFWHPFGTSDALLGRNLHAVDFSETDKNVKVKIDIPGYDPDQVNVEIDDDNVLTIRGETREEKEMEGEKWYRKERSTGSFSRSVALPSYVNADKAECSAKNGSLEIIIPKKKETGKKSIKINVKK